MAADPFSGTLRCRDPDTGEPVGFRFTASDVQGDFVQFPDLDASSIQVPNRGLDIVDLTLKPGAGGGFGVDTDSLVLRKGVQNKSVFLDNDLLGNTTTDRATRLQDLLGSHLEGGASYTFVQD